MAKFNYTNPAIKKLLPTSMAFWDKIKLLLSPHPVAIHGSNYTTNVGDRLISLIIKNELRKRNVPSIIISRFSDAPYTDKVVVAGGGVLHNNYLNNINFRTSFLRAKTSVFYVGVGCPGFSNLSEQDIKQLSKLRSSTYFSVRDKNSLKNLVQIDKELENKILLRACPSWLFLENLNISDFSIRSLIFRGYYNFRFGNCGTINSIPTFKPKIGLVINGHFDLTYLTPIINKIKELQLENEVIFIPFVGEDLEFYMREIKPLGIKCQPLKDPISTFKHILKMDKMVATRYHSLVLTLLANKPVMILGYEQKVIDLAEDLNLDYFNMVNPNNETLIFNNYDQKIIEVKVNLARTQMDEFLKFIIHTN
jgi:hypothetical protein